MILLVVDDDATICNGTARRLMNMNHPSIAQVHCVYSGEAAQAWMQTHTLDVLITDIRMDAMDGLELIARAKAMHPHMLCVVVTAYDHFQYAQRAIRLGVEDFLVKPCSIVEMQSCIQKVVDRCAALRTQRQSQLEVALNAGHSAEDILGSLRDAGIALPEGKHFQVAAWTHGLQREWPGLEGVWSYAFDRGMALLCTQPDASNLEHMLSHVLAENGQAVGLSAATGVFPKMVSQALEALELAWFWSRPQVIAWQPTPKHETDSAAQQLVCALRTFQLPLLRKELLALAMAPGRQTPWRFAQTIDILHHTLEGMCAQEWQAPPAPLPKAPGLGYSMAIQALLQGAERLQRAMTDEAALEPIAYAKTFLHTHLHEQVDMAALALRLNLSYSHFSRMFQKQTGHGFQEHLRQLRMEEACRGLLAGERVASIAQRVGYQNANNFTRSFTKYFGMSPVAWREVQCREQGGRPGEG